MDECRPLLVDTGRGFSLKYRSRLLYSGRDPVAAPRQAAIEAPVLPGTLYVVPSPCLCYGLPELLGRLPDSSAVLCLEADEALFALASHAIDEAMPAGSLRQRLALSNPARALDAYLSLERSIAPGRFRRSVELRLSGGRAFSEATYDAARATIEGDISTRYRNRLSLVRMGRLWTRNVLSNLASMRWEDTGPLEGDGKPVVVCGAGPSLDGAMDAIRRSRDGVTVLACDTATGSLAKAGIVPDAIVCLEGQIWNVADFLPLDGAAPALFVDLSAHPSSFRAITGRKSLLLSVWTESAFLSRLLAAGLPVTAAPPLGSVGVLALRIARWLGGPIVVAGLDFSFRPGMTHCRGSPADIREMLLESRTYRNTGAWGTSFREGATRSGGAITDPALSLYASLAAAELDGLEAWDLRGGFGAPLPARPLSARGLESLVETSRRDRQAAARATSAAAPACGQAASPEACRAKAAAFLAGELDRVERVSSALRHGAAGEDLREMLAEADFLYLHFPDPERVLALESDA
ncbi:MAG: hypothetical protein CVV51_04100, partial [Spirochaetae bacterium HGW-Spirochaetae-7]